MRRHLACALSALAMGWFSGQGQGQPLPPLGGQNTVVSPNSTTTVIPMPTGGAPTMIPMPTGGAPPSGHILDPGHWDDHGEGCRYHWELGGGVLYIQPTFKTNPAYKTTTVAGTTTTSTQTDFSYNMRAAPTAWLAWVSDCGFGVRGRWFQFDQGSSINVTNPGGSTITPVSPDFGTAALTSLFAGDALTFTSRLRVDVWDIEGTYAYKCCKWNLLFGAGVRYANLQQNYTATNTLAAGATAGLGGTLTSSHTFNGAGPSFSLESKRQLGETGFSFYGNARAAILFGSGNQNVSSTTAAGLTVNGSSSQTDVLPVGEVEVGLEWARECGRARFFVQTGFIGQAWFGGGNSANTNLGGTTSNNDTNFGFVGVALRAGVNF